MGGRGGCAQVMEREEVFFVTFDLFFVSMRKGKGNMGGGDRTCVVVDRRIGR